MTQQTDLEKLVRENQMLKGLGIAATVALLFTNRRRIMGTMFCGVCGVLCCILAIIGFIVGTITRQQELGAVRDAYGERLAGLCDPVSGGEASLNNVPDGERPLGVLILEADDKIRHDWHDGQPLGWVAEDESSTQMVACVMDIETLVETCENPDDDRIRDVDRNQMSAEVILLNAETGRRIAETTLQGPEPPICPEDYETVRTRYSTFGIDGDPVDINEYVTWVESAVGE
jgi:hypothetical protein